MSINSKHSYFLLLYKNKINIVIYKQNIQLYIYIIIYKQKGCQELMVCPCSDKDTCDNVFRFQRLSKTLLRTLNIWVFGTLNLTKEIQLLQWNCSTLQKIKEEIRKWKHSPCSWIDRIIGKLIYRFNATTIQNWYADLMQSQLKYQ